MRRADAAARLARAHGTGAVQGDRLTLLRGPATVQPVLELSGVETLLPFAD